MKGNQFWRSFAEKFKADVRKADYKTARDGVTVAQKYSSGPFSLAELARMDHPYARRHSAALLPPSIINAQTGKFKAAWDAKKQPVPTIFNSDPIAIFLEKGTRYMVARPIDKVIIKALQPIRLANLGQIKNQ